MSDGRDAPALLVRYTIPVPVRGLLMAGAGSLDVGDGRARREAEAEVGVRVYDEGGAIREVDREPERVRERVCGTGTLLVLALREVVGARIPLSDWV